MSRLLSVIVCVLVSMCYGNQDSSGHIDSNAGSYSKIDSAPKSSVINVSNLGGKIEIEANDDLLDKHLPWISALLVGLCSVLVSLFVGVRQVKIAKMQIEKSVSMAKDQICISKEQIDQSAQSTIQTLRANIVSSNRQNWINELRDLYARFVVVSCRMVINSHERKTKPSEIKRLKSEMVEIFNEMRYCSTKIDLLLNPKEEISRSIVENIRVAMLYSQEGENSALVEKQNEISNLMKEVFRSEWIKIKDLK